MAEEFAQLVRSVVQVNNDFFIINVLFNTGGNYWRHFTKTRVVDHVLLVQDVVSSRSTSHRAKVVREAETANTDLSRPHGVEERGKIFSAATVSAVAVHGVVDAPR
eukprot:2165618-Heterocapsa_arctica.AAC.1